MSREPLGAYTKRGGELVPGDVMPMRLTRPGFTYLYGRGRWLALSQRGCRTMDQAKLTIRAHRVFWYLLSRVEAGNHIRERSSDIAKGMCWDPSDVSRGLRQLRDAGVILDRDPWGFRLSPEIGFFGDPEHVVHKSEHGVLSLVSDVKPYRASRPEPAPAPVVRPAPAARPALPDDDPDDPGFPWAPPPDDDEPEAPDDGSFSPVKL